MADQKGRTACHYAALLGRHDVLQAFGEAWRAQASEEYDRKVSDLRGRLVEASRDCRRRNVEHELRGAYEFAAREADRELRQRSKVRGGLRTCCTTDDLGRTPLHYAVACVDAAHTALTVRALMTGSAI